MKNVQSGNSEIVSEISDISLSMINCFDFMNPYDTACNFFQQEFVKSFETK